MIKIYCSENNDLTEFESIKRGYRSDIYVRVISGQIYHLSVFDIIRLQQEFEYSIREAGFYSIDPNLILVEEVSISNIKLTIEKLMSEHFFDHLKPIGLEDINIEEMTEV